MNGFSPHVEFNAGPDAMQQEVLDRICYLCKLASDLGTYTQALAPEAALRALLQGKSEYHAQESPVSLARFELERISLPETLQGVPHLEEVLPQEALQYLKSPEQMVKQSFSSEELVTPYYDPSLRIPRNYKNLMLKLHDIGYLRFTRKPRARAGIFFVHKSDKKKIRMIVDARPANQIFRAPPGVQLCTSEGFARIEVEVPDALIPGSEEFRKHLESRGLYFGLADVKDCWDETARMAL